MSASTFSASAPPNLTAWSREEIEALLRVGRAGANGDVQDLLRVVASEARICAKGQGASIVLRGPDGRLHLALSIGLSADWGNAFAEDVAARWELGDSPSVIVEDLRERVGAAGSRAPWSELALREGFRSSAAVPLMTSGRAIGALIIYRRSRGRWTAQTLEMLTYFARQAASSITRAALFGAQRRQEDALEQLIDVLREQTKAYADRLWEIAGHLTSGDSEGAAAYLDTLIVEDRSIVEVVVKRLRDPVIAGLVVALISKARRDEINLNLDPDSRLDSLPASLFDVDAVSIIANLVVNALEAVGTLPVSRRRATLRIHQDEERVQISVRDWGRGIPAGELRSVFERGASSKPGHSGVGLSVVANALAAVDGELAIEQHPQGTSFTVTIPCRPSKVGGLPNQTLGLTSERRVFASL